MNNLQPDLVPTTQAPNTLGEALKFYELVYMPSRNFAVKTRVEYRNDLRDVIAFLEGRGKNLITQISQNDLEEYLAELDRKGYAGTSRKRKTYAIKSFFGVLHRFGHTGVDVAQRLIPPRSEHKEPRVLTKREYLALLRVCAHEPRDAAIIELLLQTGIRLSEVAQLSVDDVELPTKISPDPETVGRLHVFGKGRKSRWIPLNYKACRSLKTWLRIRPETDPEGLFVTKYRGPMGARSIQQAVKKYLAEAGIKGASVHTLRHTFATHHVAQGTSLRTVQEVLGHADLKTTSIYVQLAQETVTKELQEHAL